MKNFNTEQVIFKVKDYKMNKVLTLEQPFMNALFQRCWNDLGKLGEVRNRDQIGLVYSKFRDA